MLTFGVALNWEDLPNRSVVVDVGGGIGSTSMLLANAFKHLRFVIQDRDPVVEMGLAVCLLSFTPFALELQFQRTDTIVDVEPKMSREAQLRTSGIPGA